MSRWPAFELPFKKLVNFDSVPPATCSLRMLKSAPSFQKGRYSFSPSPGLKAPTSYSMTVTVPFLAWSVPQLGQRNTSSLSFVNMGFLHPGQIMGTTLVMGSPTPRELVDQYLTGVSLAGHLSELTHVLHTRHLHIAFNVAGRDLSPVAVELVAEEGYAQADRRNDEPGHGAIAAQL